MPVILHLDELAGDARWSKLAELDANGEPLTLTRRQFLRRLNDLQAAYFRMTLYVGHQRDDGYIGHREALDHCYGDEWVLQSLTRAVRGKPPFLHQQGQSCAEKNCIDKSPPWVEGFEYRICAFLKGNASRREKERHQEQVDDAKSSTLRAILLERDGPFCRYCRSGPLNEKAVRSKGLGRRKVMQKDHPDPDAPAGPNGENYVIACAYCNEGKGHRTPFEADMVLLDPPTEQEKAEWTARGLAMFDRPPFIPGSPPEQRRNSDPITVPISDPNTDPDSVPTTPDDHEATTETPGEQHEQASDQQPGGFRPGRVGQPAGGVLGPLGQPVRDASSPDIWTRRSRAPVAHGPPAGGVP